MRLCNVDNLRLSFSSCFLLFCVVLPSRRPTSVWQWVSAAVMLHEMRAM